MNYLQPELIVYWLFAFTVISLWIPLSFVKHTDGTALIQWWHIPFLITIIVALYQNLLDWIALPVIAGFYLICWLAAQPLKLAWLNSLILAVFGLALGFTLFPGFEANIVINVPNDDGLVTQQDYRFNISKYLIGLFLVGLLCKRIGTLAELKDMLIKVLPVIAITVFCVFTGAVLIGLVGFDPHLSPQLLLWVVSNLLFVCVTEEAFFRLFIQQRLSIWLNKLTRHGTWIALVITSLFFGLVHFGFGWTYVIIACIAGLGYGYAYIRTGRIEAAILTHFLVNLIHYILFTYPMLEQ